MAHPIPLNRSLLQYFGLKAFAEDNLREWETAFFWVQYQQDGQPPVCAEATVKMTMNGSAIIPVCCPHQTSLMASRHMVSEMVDSVYSMLAERDELSVMSRSGLDARDPDVCSRLVHSIDRAQNLICLVACVFQRAGWPGSNRRVYGQFGNFAEHLDGSARALERSVKAVCDVVGDPSSFTKFFACQVSGHIHTDIRCHYSHDIHAFYSAIANKRRADRTDEDKRNKALLQAVCDAVFAVYELMADYIPDTLEIISQITA